MLDSQVLRNPMAVTFRKGTLDPHIISINMNRYPVAIIPTRVIIIKRRKIYIYIFFLIKRRTKNSSENKEAARSARTIIRYVG